MNSTVNKTFYIIVFLKRYKNMAQKAVKYVVFFNIQYIYF